MITPLTNPARQGWRFWLIWMAASIFSALVFLILAPVLYGLLIALVPALQNAPAAPEQQWLVTAINLLSIAVLSSLIGAAQWWVLRQYLPHCGWWIPATAIGYTLPLALMQLIQPGTPDWLTGAVMFLLFGGTLGVLQWAVLRGRVDHAEGWILLSLGSWLLAYVLTGVAYLTGFSLESFDLLAAFLVPLGATGAGLIWLLRRTTHLAPTPR